TRGNTASASIPIALSEYRKNGTFNPGDLILSVAVGAGWYYGGLLFRI
ncbi:3-oxoacyl-[acyl-carrier-protein] synthase III C-terminal domain-containing protein, partial [Streptomyces sp. NPDC052013]